MHKKALHIIGAFGCIAVIAQILAGQMSPESLKWWAIGGWALMAFNYGLDAINS